MAERRDLYFKRRQFAAETIPWARLAKGSVRRSRMEGQGEGGRWYPVFPVSDRGLELMRLDRGVEFGKNTADPKAVATLKKNGGLWRYPRLRQVKHLKGTSKYRAFSWPMAAARFTASQPSADKHIAHDRCYGRFADLGDGILTFLREDVPLNRIPIAVRYQTVFVSKTQRIAGYRLALRDCGDTTALMDARSAETVMTGLRRMGVKIGERAFGF